MACSDDVPAFVQIRSETHLNEHHRAALTLLKIKVYVNIATY